MIKSESQSRRVRITKQMLKDALMELLESQPLSAISVTKLCQLADVNRSTFYSYYDDILDLLKEIENDLIEQIPVIQKPAPRTAVNQQMIKEFSVFFKYIRSHGREFNILLKMGDLSFRNQLIDVVIQNTENEVHDQFTHWTYIFAVNGTIGIILDWIAKGFPLGDDEFTELVFQMNIQLNTSFPAKYTR